MTSELTSRPADTTIAIVGLGYVDLPLAVALVEAGCSLVGVDADPRRVAELVAGRSLVDDIDDGRLAAALAGGLSVTGTDTADLAAPDVVFVCVPTPITASKDPDLGPVLSAAARIREQLRPGQLVVLQSTTYPGTTAGPFRRELERSGLLVDWDPRKAAANLLKHRVSFEEAQTAFLNEDALVIEDPDHFETEDRFILLGLRAALRVLFVCHCVREGGSLFRLISARRVTRHEQEQYHERVQR